MTKEKKFIPIDVKELPINPIDLQSPVPLYHQITLDLRRLIEEQIVPPGALLPPETEISQIYGVGRQTIRRAIARLVDENLVERYAGRGTFVRDQHQRASFQLDRSFSQYIKSSGKHPHSKILAKEESFINKDCPPQFHKHLEKPCLILERVRYSNQEPICYQVTNVITDQCPGLNDYNFAEESLYEVLAKEYGMIINRIDHSIRAISADDYRAELLEVDPGAPLLQVTTIAYLENGEAIEVTFSNYRADRYEYRTTEIS
jgi:GntR family transcriptional regulator